VARRGEIVGAVDFGARDIRVLIGRKTQGGVIQVIGHGVSPSNGCVSQGVIQELGSAQVALKRALAAAEKEAGTSTQSLFCGVNGRNVETFIREGTVKLEKEVVELGHLDAARDAASKDITDSGKRPVANLSTEEWYVDDLRVTDPLGIRGSTLKARVHFAQIPSVIEENIISCVESQGREVEDVVFLPLAAGLGCLTPEDIELGVAVLDIGRTTTGLAVYRDRRILATRCFEWGGFHITRDVSAGLQISFEEAVDLILQYGISARLVHEEDCDAKADEELSLGEERNANIKLKTAVRGAPTIVQRSNLDMIVFERSKELMTKVRQFLQGQGLMKNLVRGIVLAGGSAQIAHQATLAEAVFQVPARIGLPAGIDMLPQQINSAEFVPVIGVLRHGFDYCAAVRSGRFEVARGPVQAAHHMLKRMLGKYFP
jgi:cell division protein FtsA